MYYTTGFSREQITDMCAMLHKEYMATGERFWPPILGLYKSTVVALAYMRGNRIEAELGETFEVSQPTISRAVTGVTPMLAKVLEQFVPTADDLDESTQYIVDGTLLPCWSWAVAPELYSGKRKTTGMNVQVAATLDGRLAWVSDAVEGRRHDTYCLKESEVLVTLDPANWIGDKGYVGNDMITPIKKPAHRELLDWENEFNRQVNKIRYVIEQVIAHFKDWEIMHADYRRPLKTFKETISTVIALHFYQLSPE
jgi:hypothetical protein